MNIYEIAKELTITALNNGYTTKKINQEKRAESTYIAWNEQVDENVAAFYNKLI